MLVKCSLCTNKETVNTSNHVFDVEVKYYLVEPYGMVCTECLERMRNNIDENKEEVK